MASGSQSQIGPISQQYAAAATVPLIKSPSLWLPKPIELPGDIHPLPDDITAYFVYPFSLEEHVLSLRPSPHEAISSRRARNAEILHHREVEEEQKDMIPGFHIGHSRRREKVILIPLRSIRRDNLKRIAPGYNPSSVLLPTSQTTSSHRPAQSSPFSLLTTTTSTSDPTSSGQPAKANPNASHDPMDELVAQLEEMESRR